jgi:hypothetical protein
VSVTHEHLKLWDRVMQVQLRDGKDRLVWRWTPDGKYSSKSAYRALQMTSHSIPGCSRIWKTWGASPSQDFLMACYMGTPLDCE